MTTGNEYTTETARVAATRDELGDWVAGFLCSPGSDNASLAASLAGTPRWWIGPVQLPLHQLHRLAGPPGAPVLEEVEEDCWRDDVEDLCVRIEQGLEPAPVVVSYRDGQLVLEDGNHRVEALRRTGVPDTWAVVAFGDPDERDRFLDRSESISGDGIPATQN